MGAWYLIGVLAGLGTAIGALCSGIVPGRIAVLVAAAVAGAIGVELYGWAEALGGLLGGAVGGFGTIPIVRGARRRGGTRWGLASLIGLGALVVALLALVPVLGYLEAVALPAVALRLRSTQPERFAGLRTLARD